MSSLEDKKKEKVHTREISLSTFNADDGCIIVEGELLDNRLEEVYQITTGLKKPPGVVHNMKVRILVGPPGLTIRDVEVEMPTIPREECPETIKSAQKIKGMTISTGYSERVRALLRGKEGCAHLTMLIIAMGPEAVQGHFTNYARSPLKKDAKEIVAMGLKDTCYVWREDGAMYQDLIKNNLS